MLTSNLSRTVRPATPAIRFHMRGGRFIAVSIFIAVLAALFISASSASSFYGFRKARTGSTPAPVRVNKSKPVVWRSDSLRPNHGRNITSTLFSTLLPQAIPADDVATFAADCVTPKSSFTLGETVCATVSGNPDLTNFPRRLALVDSANFVREVTPVATDPENISFTLPTTPTSIVGLETVDNRGGWRINSLPGGSNRVRASAFFTVSDPDNEVANLVIYKSGEGDGNVVAGSNLSFGLWLTNRGPDTATAVEVTDAVPANTTFVSGQQDSGPTFTCQTDFSSCTISALAPGATATFTITYMVASVPEGTIISNTASISSETAELNDVDNTETSTAKVIAGTPTTCTLDCPNNISTTANTTQGGEPGAFVTYTAPEAFGTCGTVTTNPTSGSFFPVGTTQVSVSSSTGGGSCSFTVTVIDSPAPTITCPPNQSVEAPSGQTEASVDPGTPTATGTNVVVTGVRNDNRAISDPYPIGTTSITWTATECTDPPSCSDPFARSASCVQTITVTDATPITINCPADVTVTAPSGTCEATVNPGTATASPSSATVEGHRSDGLPLTDPYPAGQTTITWTATGTDGRVASCTQIITVNANDTTPPTLIAPPDVTATTSSCSALLDDELGVATADDNCTSSVSITRTGVPRIPCPIPGDPTRTCESFVFPVGTTTITYTATDAAGNTAIDTQLVTVTEDPAVPPTITAPADPAPVSTGAGATICGALVDDATLGTATANDNCPGVTIARTGVPAGNIFPVGNTVVTYTATDASGNTATDTQTVTVVDNTLPVVTPPAPVTLFTGPGATSCNVTVANLDTTLGTGSATDNCPGVGAVIRTGVPAGNVFPLGETILTYSATDAHGNTGTATQVVTVVDNTAPVISCPANIVLEPTCPTGAIATWTAPVGTDNCPGATTTQTAGPASGSVFPIGTTTVTYTVNDAHGNSASCNFTVTVQTPAQVVQNMIAAVNAIPGLTGQQRQGLLSKLQAALDAINENKINVACNKLSDFISQVQSFINNGTLTSAQGQPLLNSAAHVRNTLGCTNQPCS